MSLKVEVDWNKDGSYAGVYDNVTDLVRARFSGVTLTYGRDQSTAVAPTIAGNGSMVLDNTSRRFSPRNTASPLYGLVKPARPVRITRTLPTSGTTYTLGLFHSDDNPINPDPESKTVTMGLVDSLADFRGLTISTPLYQGITTGQAIGYVLDACGWPAPARDLDNGGTVIPFWWEDNTDALDALGKILRSEGPPALLTVGSNGSIQFKDRWHRLVDAASLTAQATFRGAGVIEPTMNKPFEYDDAWRNIINSGIMSVDVRTPGDLDVVWQIESPLGFTNSEVKTFIAQASDPFFAAVAPVSGTDYTVNTGSIASATLSRDSGGSTTITITAGAGGAQISGLQLRAKPVQVAYTVQVTDSDASSITDYGIRSLPGDLPWCNQYDAAGVLGSAIDQYAQPNPVVYVRFLIGSQAPGWEARAAKVLGLNLSDRVTIIEPETALNTDFYVESIKHEFNGEWNHAVTLGLEACPPTGAVTSSNVFLIGGGVGHQIGDGVLA